MKMISTPTVATANQYAAYVHNCLRNRACELSYSAPLPGVPYLQLYADFGNAKPVMVEFILVDTCTGNQEQIFPSNYVIGQTPDGTWYGVFKYFNSPVVPVTTFVVWLSATDAGLQERTYFTEMLMVEPCDPLTKIKACQPEGATTTGFDINGLYYGLPVNMDFLGIGTIRYFHIAFVRNTKVREMGNKATFKSSLTRNFRTTIEKTYQIETELVPQWYKNELLGIYARGVVQINDGKMYLVSDLNFEALNDDDVTWKPFAQLKDTFRLFFGCDDSRCIECCSPIILDAYTTTESESGSGDQSASGSVTCQAVTIADGQVLADAPAGAPYEQIIFLSGDGPFTIDNEVGPAWLNFALIGNEVHLTGTPAFGDIANNVAVSFTAHNCVDDSADYATTMNVVEGYTAFEGGFGDTGSAACSFSTTLYIGPGHIIVEPGAVIYFDIDPPNPVGSGIVRDQFGQLWFVVGNVVTMTTGDVC